MQKIEATWKKDGDWKARYSRLYSSRRISNPQEEKSCRISFLSSDPSPQYAASSRRSSLQSNDTDRLTSILAQRSDQFQSDTTGQNVNSSESDNLGGHDTKLLDMVRGYSKELEEARDKTLNLPDNDQDHDSSTEVCVHGYPRHERSVSRSRVSRASARRDMDIPAILACVTDTADKVPLTIQAFQQPPAAAAVAPRWSVRRSACAVCSQKWRDRTHITNVRYSGLKRNSSLELPSVIAPARLRAAITMAYAPRPALAAVYEEAPHHRAMRNTSAAWQLTRARKFRAPKPLLPPPEATAPPSATAPLARKDLDIRVNKFLAD